MNETMDFLEHRTPEQIIGVIASVLSDLEGMGLERRVQVLNSVRAELHKYSPFANEPVDFVEWVKSEQVEANDYNPNSVAPPEMELLKVSISHDGYTQPIVTCPEGDKLTVVDGFHRNRVGKECAELRQRVQGYLPVVRIRASQSGREDRIASTIRHDTWQSRESAKNPRRAVHELPLRLQPMP